MAKISAILKNTCCDMECKCVCVCRWINRNYFHMSYTNFVEVFINITSRRFRLISKKFTFGWGAAGKSTFSPGLMRFRILMSTSDPKCSSGFFFFFLRVFWEAVASRLPLESDDMSRVRKDYCYMLISSKSQRGV